MPFAFFRQLNEPNGFFDSDGEFFYFSLIDFFLHSLSTPYVSKAIFLTLIINSFTLSFIESLPHDSRNSFFRLHYGIFLRKS